jgi:hypothetical protein
MTLLHRSIVYSVKDVLSAVWTAITIIRVGLVVVAAIPCGWEEHVRVRRAKTEFSWKVYHLLIHPDATVVSDAVNITRYRMSLEICVH